MNGIFKAAAKFSASSVMRIKALASMSFDLRGPLSHGNPQRCVAERRGRGPALGFSVERDHVLHGGDANII